MIIMMHLMIIKNIYYIYKNIKYIIYIHILYCI